jgi:tetratricopeptide (TPR) repeat protein
MKDLSFSSIKKAATQGLLPKRWLPKLSFALNYYVSGEQAVADSNAHLRAGSYGKVIGSEVDQQAKGFHLVNVIIHILAALFVYGMFLITLETPALKGVIWKGREIALLAALLWAVHPIQTNAVTYIVQRMTSMSAMFSFLAVFLYGLARQSERKILWRVLCLGFCLLSFFCALLSKENAAMLPVMILGYELFFVEKLNISWSNWKLYVGTGVALILVFLISWFYLEGNPINKVMGSTYALRDFTMGERLLTEPRVIFHYLSLLILPLPSRLNLSYDYEISHSLVSPPETLFAIAGLCGLVYLIFWFYKQDRLLSFAIFWFLGNLLIESSVVGLEIIFEHRLYLPSTFLLLAGVNCLYKARGKGLQIVRVGLTVAVILLMAITWHRNITWSSRENIWADIAEKSPNISRGHLGLYFAYKSQGRIEEATQALLRAVEVEPENFQPSFNLANIYMEQENYREALNILNRMLANPKMRRPSAYDLRAFIFLQQKNYPMAIIDAENVVHYNPSNIRANQTMASAYFQLRNYNKALIFYKKVRALKPMSWSSYFNLGMTHEQLGNIDKAIAMYQQAQKMNPGNKQIYTKLTSLYTRRGMME